MVYGGVLNGRVPTSVKRWFLAFTFYTGFALVSFVNIRDGYIMRYQLDQKWYQ